MILRPTLPAILTLLAVISGQLSDECNADETEINFSRDVLPILSNKCFVCHGPDTTDAEMLRLDSFESATADRGGHKAIDPDQLAKSELIARLESADDPMPPADAEKQLTSAERQTLLKWVRSGGRYAKHWAFLIPEKQSLADVRDPGIDEFIAARMKAAGTDFAEDADRATLARRVSLVLTGLPPDPEHLERFLADTREESYDRFVDELLEKPQYGEHQARYWLDAVRYGDTHGLHLDNRRGIFPYRDWVVQSMNSNLPLDDFITWQLAGDLLPSPTLGQLVATGFVRMNPSTAEGGAIPAEFQAKNNFDRTETLGTVLLGMSMTCARCHTHKYDPIPQTEYYRLLAFFNSTAEKSMDGNKYEYGPVIKVPQDQDAWSKWNEVESDRDRLLKSATGRIQQQDDIDKTFLSEWQNASSADRLKLLVKHKEVAGLIGVTDEAKRISQRVQDLEARFTTSLVARDLPSPRVTHVLKRGEYNLPSGEPVEPGILTVMGEFPEGAPRNRLGLARWLTSPEHPLVSRVLVNRIWQRVFGDGLVRTPEDFGLQGEQPTHPILLDWLAVELQESGWDLKHMLRMMVTSRTFRQSSAWRQHLEDPENRLFARGPSYRLDAEVIRDIGLWSSGMLDPHMGGEGVKPYQPAGMWLAMAHPASNTKKYEKDSGERLYRRSLYVYWKRTSPHPMMTLFDAPDRESSCVRRSRTNTPLQSLGLLNEIQRVEMSRKLAERLIRADKQDKQRLSSLFQLIASREPQPVEFEACLKLLIQMKQRYAGAPDDAAALLSTGDASSDESLDSVEVAAWTQVASAVLASDIAILLY